MRSGDDDDDGDSEGEGEVMVGGGMTVMVMVMTKMKTTSMCEQIHIQKEDEQIRPQPPKQKAGTKKNLKIRTKQHEPHFGGCLCPRRAESVQKGRPAASRH